MNETLKAIQLDGNNNVVLQSVSASGDITINTLDWDTFVQRYTYEQQAHIQELQKLLERSEKLFDLEKLQLSQQINTLQAEVERRETQLKEIIERYEGKDLSQMDAQYQEAFQLLIANKLDEVIALLNDDELEAELQRVEQIKQKTAEKYILKADAFQLKYKFKEAEAYLHRALRAYPDWGNCLTLANFYKNLNQFPQAEQHYQQCLELADNDYELATTLNNLANLQRAKNEYESAEISYRRALEIREQLAEVNPQTYLPDVATTLNNLAALHYSKKEYSATEQSYRRALEIRHAFAKAMPQVFDLTVCETNVNLLIFYFDKFKRQVDTEEDGQQIEKLLADTETRLQRFPTEIPLVQHYWNQLNYFKQFITEEEEEAESNPIE